MTRFLRGQAASLAVGDAVPAPRLNETSFLALDPEPAPPSREIHFVLQDAEGARVGVASLAPIHWETHGARLALSAAPGAAAEETVALLTRYAFDELNLDTLSAMPATPVAALALAALGWRDTGERRWTRAR